MKRRTLAGWVLAAVSVGAVASAQVQQAPKTLKKPVANAPLQLSVQQRLDLFNGALRQANASATPISNVPAASFRLTPGQLSHNGAYISNIGIGRTAIGTSEGNPLPPVFVFHGSPYSSIQILYPTEAGRTYVLDCEVTHTSTMRIMKAGAAIATVSGNTNRFIGAVRAGGMRESLSLEFTVTSPGNAVFSGCDLVKL